MRALKVLGRVAEVLIGLLFGALMFAISPVLGFIWLGLAIATLFLVLVIYAVRIGVKAAIDQNMKGEMK